MDGGRTRDNQTSSNAINICGIRGVDHFDQIPSNQRSRCLQFNRLILLLWFGSSSHGHSRSATRQRIRLDGGIEEGMWRACIFIPSLRRTSYSCLRIRWSKVVSYGKPQKDLLILDGRVRQRLIPFPILSMVTTTLLWSLFDQKPGQFPCESTRTIEI